MSQVSCVTGQYYTTKNYLAVHHQDVVLGVLDHPGELESGKKRFYQMRHEKIGLYHVSHINI